MNRSIATVMLGGTACLVFVSMTLAMRTARKVLADNIGTGPVCGVATLNGRFAFLRTGQNNDLPGPIAQLGVTIFDGRGNTAGTSLLASRNGDIQREFDLGSAPLSMRIAPAASSMMTARQGSHLSWSTTVKRLSA